MESTGHKNSHDLYSFASAKNEIFIHFSGFRFILPYHFTPHHNNSLSIRRSMDSAEADTQTQLKYDWFYKVAKVMPKKCMVKMPLKLIK